MFSLIFKTIEDDASASSIRITSIFSTLHDNIKLILSKAATESSFSFEDGFEESLNNDLAAINNYITAVRGGMSETEALASSFMDASAAAKDYANSTKSAEVTTEDYTTKAKLSQVSTLAQNKSLSDTKKLIDEYGTGLKKCGLSQEQYLLEIKKTNPQLAAYLANLHGADATLKGYIGSLFSAKAATIALQIATTALNAVIGMGIGLLLSLIASGLSALFDSIKEALRDPKEVIEELDEELSSLQSTIRSTARDFSDLKKNSDEIIPRFAELAKGVDEFGNRLTDANGKMILTDEEYEEFWELNNKIAEMFPDLDVGIDSNGNHILSLSYSVNTLTESLEALVEAERQAANQKIIENLDDTLENIEKAEKAYKKETTMITGKSNHLTSAYNTVKSYGDAGFSWNTSDRSDRNADRYKAKAYKDALDALGIKYTVSQSGYNTTTRMYDIENIIPDDADWDRILREYEDDLNGFSKEVEDINAKAAARWKKLNPIMGAWLQTTDSYDAVEDNVKNLLSKVIGNINYGDIGITDADDLKEYLQDNVIDTLINAAPDVQDAVRRLFLNDGELSINEFESLANKIKEQFGEDNPVYLYVKTKLNGDGKGDNGIVGMANTIKSFIKDEFDNSVDELSLDDLAIAASDDFWKFLNVPDGTLLSLDELNKKLKEYKEISDSIEQLSFEDTLSKVNALSSGLNELDKIYADIYNKEDFDWSSILDNEAFTNAFSKLDEYNGVYSKFIETVANSPDDIAACQDAFNNLTTTYIKQSGVLDNVTDATRNATVAMLEQMGISNAAAIVDANLAYQKEKLKYTTGDYADISYETILGLYEECKAGTTTKQVLAELAATKMQVNDEQIDTSKEIQQLLNLAKAANATKESIARLSEAKTYMMKAEELERQKQELIESGADPRGISAISSNAAYYRKLAEEAANAKIEYDKLEEKLFEVEYTGGKTSKNAIKSVEKTVSESTEKTETWFERQYKDHQHMVNMEQETEAQYIAWLESAYKKAYSEGIITLDEYYKYQEEVYRGYKSIQESAESWFDTQQKEHQHMLNMQKESDIAYLTWLKGAYQTAYAQGEISLDDYRKYQEEVLTGMQNVFKDYLSDVEHEISLVEGVKKDNKKVINLYKKLISATEKEIAISRMKGLSDTDDYIQELQSKLLNYANAIEQIERDVVDNAKSSVNKLIDIRIKMLKQDIQNEKDAIDKKLSYLREFYNKQKEMLQDSYDEDRYITEQNEKRKTVSRLQAEIEKLKYDDSAWAQKRKLELEQELSDAKKELAEFEKEHALQLAQDELDEMLEMQEKGLEEQSDLLDSKIDDAGALYRRALADIRNGSVGLYQEMIQWNELYGDGISETITSAWEDAYKALNDYKQLYGTLYEGVNLSNATGYTESTSPYASSLSTDQSDYAYSGASMIGGAISTAADVVVPIAASATSAALDIAKWLIGEISGSSSSGSSSTGSTSSDKRNVAAAIWDGNYGWGTGAERERKLTEVFGANNGVQALVNQGVGKNDPAPSKSYTYLNMRKKYKGYASGVKNASAGIHPIDELGTETIFESSDGNRYKMFTGGEKVLNAKASDFLYDFANTGGEILSDFIKAAMSGCSIDKIYPVVNHNEVNMGDIIIQGNANDKTVSEIRREQRSSVEYMLKQIGRLQK